MLLDVFMITLLPLLMIQALAGEQLHEWLGILLCIVFLLHHLLNVNWHKQLLHGSYDMTRCGTTILHGLLMLCMIFSAISGAMLSQYMFDMSDIDFNISFARATHMFVTHWMFLLTSLHLGMHWNVIKSYIKSSSKRTLGGVATLILTICILLIDIYGGKVFIDTQLWQYMTSQASYMFYDFHRTAVSVYLDYVSMMVLFSTIGYLLSLLLKKMTV